MAKYSNGPQKEDGYTPIANAILEAITRGKFTVYEYKCLLFLLRMTYGWSKKEDAISLKQWEAGTGINKRHVGRTLKQLERRNIIFCKSGGHGRGKTSTYGFNKYDETWDGQSTLKVPVEVPIIKVPERAPFSEEKVPVEVPTKERKKASLLAGNPRGDYIAVFVDHFGKPNNNGVQINNFDYGKICHWREQGISLVNFKDAMSRTAQVRPSNIWAYAEKILNDYASGTKQALVTQTPTVEFSMRELTQ